MTDRFYNPCKRYIRSLTFTIVVLFVCIFLAAPVRPHAKTVVPSGKKYVRHIQMLHVYSKEYEGKKLNNKKIVEFGFGKKDDFIYYVTEASVRIRITSMDGKVVYDNVRKVGKKNYTGRLCHITIKDSDIRTNSCSEEGMAEVTAVLGDGSKVRCGVGKAKVYGLPTTGDKPLTPQVIPGTDGFSAFQLINDSRYISSDAYQRVGSSQGMASDGQGHLLVFNMNSPGIKSRHSHMLTLISQNDKPIYYRFKKKLGHVNDATFYNGRYFLVTPEHGLPLVYGLKITPRGDSLSVDWKKYHADGGLRSATGNKVNGITYCNGQTHKGYPVFIMRKSSTLYRCYLKGSTFHLLNKNWLNNIPDSYVFQNVTYYKGDIYMGFARLDKHGDKKNWFVVGTVSCSDLKRSGGRKLEFSKVRSFSDAKGVEVEGAAVSNGHLYFSFNGNDLSGRQADFIVRMN